MIGRPVGCTYSRSGNDESCKSFHIFIRSRVSLIKWWLFRFLVVFILVSRKPLRARPRLEKQREGPESRFCSHQKTVVIKRSKSRMIFIFSVPSHGDSIRNQASNMHLEPRLKSENLKILKLGLSDLKIGPKLHVSKIWFQPWNQFYRAIKTPTIVHSWPNRIFHIQR